MLEPTVCQKLIDKNADGIVLVDREGVVRFSNPAADGMFGFPLLNREFGFPVMEGEATEIDLVANGHPRQVAELRAVEIGLGGQDRVFLVSLRDLTERVRMETELRQAMTAAQVAEQSKSRFLSLMSHELRTPLNAVIGFSGLLLEGSMGALNPTQEEFLRNVLHSGRELLNKVSVLLDLAELEGSSVKVRRERLETWVFLAQRVSAVYDRAREKGVKLAAEWDDAPPHFSSDERLLGRVVDLLLHNSVKFTPGGGSIRLTASRVADADGEERLEIVVTDTGMGIQPANLERIFQPFEQEGDASRHPTGGIGLGLTLARLLTRRLEGTLHAESQGENQGSRFTVRLPLRAVGTVL
ncbi:MAG: hypothetical protein HQL66_08865 [Magnetococcales bacterium]|nr:hypothetical protein [Magnetococcales bacterium]